jgi:hypothetical protein
MSLKLLPLSPYYSHNQHIAKSAWYHSHTNHLDLILSLTLGHNTYILKYLSSLFSLAEAKVASHIILPNVSHGSSKCIQLTYLHITMSKPICSPGNQVVLCLFEHLYLYNPSENVPLSRNPWRYTWNREISWKNSRWVDNRLVNCIFDADL